MKKFLWGCCAYSTLVFGGLSIFVAITSKSYPEIAAYSALACAFAVLPYCFARAVEKF